MLTSTSFLHFGQEISFVFFNSSKKAFCIDKNTTNKYLFFIYFSLQGKTNDFTMKITPKMKNAPGQFRFVSIAVSELVSQRTMLNTIIPIPINILCILQLFS
jgi:hypothetical protein